MEEFIYSEKSTYEKVLDVLVFFAVFLVTIFFIIEIIPDYKRPIDITLLNKYYFYINVGILIIFILDLVRLYKESKDYKDFIANNWLDILATIPFGLIAYFMGTKSVATNTNAILKASRIGKLSRLGKAEKLMKASRVSKISKEFKAAAHLKKESEEYKKKHRL